MKDNTTIELVRIIDARKAEYQYIVSQLGSGVKHIDLEVYNTINEEALTAKLKYVAGYNHYSKRHVIINNNLVKQECP